MGISLSTYLLGQEYGTPPHELYERYSENPWRMGYDMKVTEIGYDKIEEKKEEMTGGKTPESYREVSKYAKSKRKSLQREIGLT